MPVPSSPPLLRRRLLLLLTRMLYFQMVIMAGTVMLAYYFEYTDTFSVNVQGFFCYESAYRKPYPGPEESSAVPPVLLYSLAAGVPVLVVSLEGRPSRGGSSLPSRPLSPPLSFTAPPGREEGGLLPGVPHAPLHTWQGWRLVDGAPKDSCTAKGRIRGTGTGAGKDGWPSSLGQFGPGCAPPLSCHSPSAVTFPLSDHS